MLTSQKWKRTFWRDYIFFMEDASSSSAYSSGAGERGGARHARARAVLCYNTIEWQSYLMPLVVSASIVLLRICDILLEGMGRRGAWRRHLTTPKSCETAVSNNYLYGDEWRIGRKYSWVAFRIAFAFVITRGVTSLQGRKGISL